jgi:RNA polymerase sigma factor (sigma-70 family)
MIHPQLQDVVHHLRHLTGPQTAPAPSERELLDRFIADRDEAAFAALVERHAPMVLGVCRRVLRHAHDAEDACQATFLVFARKAASVRKRESLASWLHGVAYHVATRLKRDLARRGAREALRPEAAQADVAVEACWRELRGLLDDELARLPARYRSPLVLCYLEGRTRDEAAQQLGWSLTTFRGRLERGRERLRARLIRRGLTLSAALFAGALGESSASAAPPPAFVVRTVKAALLYAAGRAAPDGFSVQAVALAEGVLKTMLLSKLKFVTAALVALAVLGASAAGLMQRALADKPAAAPAQQPAAERPADPPAKAKPEPDVQPVVEKKKDEAPPTAVSGVVTALDALKGTLTVEHRQGTDTFNVATDAKINIDGKPGQLAALPVGAIVTLTQFVDAKTAGSVQAGGRSYFGNLVTAVDAGRNTITIKDRDTEMTFGVAPDACITVDGKHTKLAAVPVGSFANVSLAADQQTARSIGADGPDLGGCGGSCVKAVDAENGTITFDDKAAAEVAGKTFTVAKDALVTIEGKPGKLADIPPGAHVNLLLTVDRQAARQVRVQGPPALCDCGGSLVKAVDAEKGTITFADKARAEVAGKTFTVAPDAFILIDAKPGKLADLPPGSYVDLILSLDRQTARQVRANGPPVPGVGVVKAVDTEQHTITVGDKTYPVAKDANIVIDGKPCKLTGVPTGVYVSLNLCVDQKTVGTIHHAKAP